MKWLKNLFRKREAISSEATNAELVAYWKSLGETTQPKKPEMRDLMLARCVDCPFNLGHSRFIFEKDREEHEFHGHTTEPLQWRPWALSKGYFKQVEEEALRNGELTL